MPERIVIDVVDLLHGLSRAFIAGYITCCTSEDAEHSDPVLPTNADANAEDWFKYIHDQIIGGSTLGESPSQIEFFLERSDINKDQDHA